MKEDLNVMPVGLSAKGKTAYKTIMAVLNDKCDGNVDTGGCKTFYSPAEWKARGEEYCTKAELIVVYDGGVVPCFFNSDYECYQCIELMDNELEKAGLYFEPATGWYGGVYLI